MSGEDRLDRDELVAIREEWESFERGGGPLKNLYTAYRKRIPALLAEVDRLSTHLCDGHRQYHADCGCLVCEMLKVSLKLVDRDTEIERLKREVREILREQWDVVGCKSPVLPYPEAEPDPSDGTIGEPT